jgi:hypothetical protein
MATNRGEDRPDSGTGAELKEAESAAVPAVVAALIVMATVISTSPQVARTSVTVTSAFAFRAVPEELLVELPRLAGRRA